MDTTLNNLLKGLAEALAPFLPGGNDVEADEGRIISIVEDAIGDADLSDAVENVIDNNYDFDDIVSDKIDDHDFSSVIDQAVGDIYWPDYDVLTSGNFDASDYELVTTDDVRDIVTEELRETGAAVTVDNILSTLAAALTAAAEARAA